MVIAGANPEAYIDNLAFEHSDGSIATDETEAIICAGAFLNDSVELPGARTRSRLPPVATTVTEDKPVNHAAAKTP